jgi:hypothetical protein
VPTKPDELQVALQGYSQQVLGCDQNNCKCAGSKIIDDRGQLIYEQIMDSRSQYQNVPVSQADHYNGIELEGYDNLTWGAVRIWRQGDGWTGFQDGNSWPLFGMSYISGKPVFRLLAIKRNGRWEFSMPDIPGPIPQNRTAMQCDAMPK